MLASLEGARMLEVQKRFELYENPMLRSLHGLTFAPESISLRLSGGALEDVEILSGIAHIASLEIDGVPQLESLSGLETLTSIGNLALSDNDFLTDLSALGSLQSVETALSIARNRSLVSLAGLESLTQTEQLYITGNAKLGSIAALTSLTSVELGFRIEDNPSLPTCAAQALVGQTEHQATLVTIRGNDDTGVCAP